jgi:hypothetical protein
MASKDDNNKVKIIQTTVLDVHMNYEVSTIRIGKKNELPSRLHLQASASP